MIRALSLAALLLASPAVVRAAPPAAQAPAAPAIVQREHISIRDEGGRGPVVILIPGLSSPRAVYDGIVPVLRRDHRVLTVQVNGFDGGDPRANTKPGVLDGIVAELADHIAREKIAAPAVVGHSMGGLVAMMLAVRHPDRVGRVMVIDALPFIGTIFDPAATAQSVAPRAAQMRDAMAAAPQAAADAAPITADPGGIWSITPKGRMQVAEWSRRANPAAVAQAMYEDFTTDLRGEMSRLKARPFHVLYATGAGPQAKAIWERDYAGSGATLVPVADSWHFIMLDQPAAFEAAMRAFLAAP